MKRPNYMSENYADPKTLKNPFWQKTLNSIKNENYDNNDNVFRNNDRYPIYYFKNGTLLSTKHEQQQLVYNFVNNIKNFQQSEHGESGYN